MEQEFELASLDLAFKSRGNRQQHGAVRVVTAGVDDFILTVDLKRKGVHVGAHHNAGAGLSTGFNGDHTGLCDTGRDLIAHFLELFSNIGARFHFLETEFRNFVQVVINFNDIEFLSHGTVS